jgi:hypothetical protein
MFLSCLGYTNKLPTACNEYRIGSMNKNRTNKNVTNRNSKNATFHHLRNENFTYPDYTA